MLQGLLRTISADQMEQIHQAVLHILEKTGLQIQGRFLLEALADAGWRVNFDKHRAWFKPDLVERQISAQKDRYQKVRSSLWYPFCSRLPDNDVAWPDEFVLDYGFGTPFIYDYPTGMYRKPTAKDLIDMIKLGQALPEVKAVNAPFVCGDFDSRMESLESARLLLLHTDKPGWVATTCGQEVKYLVELAQLAVDHNNGVIPSEPAIFVNAYCTTSPLKLDKRSCDVLAEALKYKFPVNFATMPILGGTTPVTPAGSVLVAAAELLGCITATSLIDPEIMFYTTSIAAVMDMRTAQVCYAVPQAILTDVSLHQLFRTKYGLVLNVEPAYVEAKCPGIQAALLKAYRQMAFGATVSTSLPIGLLDSASTFSPTQAMIDRDINLAEYGFTRSIEVSPETLCADLIDDMEFCEKSAYIQTDHTFRHFRDLLWDSQLLDRTTKQEHTYLPDREDEALLQQADQAWRKLVETAPPVGRDKCFLRELDRTVEAARRELLM
jgi:trimethylamine--corrinoid protein Co-methyltransferase